MTDTDTGHGHRYRCTPDTCHVTTRGTTTPRVAPSALPAAALAAALGVQDEVGLALEVAAGGHLLLLGPALHILLFLNR